MSQTLPDTTTTYTDGEGRSRTGDDGVTGANALIATIQHLWSVLSGATQSTTTLPDLEAVCVPEVTVATLPTASEWTGGMVYVSDETGGAIIAFSDGSDWRRVTDRAVVS